MKYWLLLESRAKKDVKSLDTVSQKRIAKKLKFFLNQPEPLSLAKKLVDPADGDYRWRIGNYRAVFDVQDNKIRVLRIQHRKDIYRK